MNIYKLQSARRTIRKFQDKEVPFEILEKLVDYGRLSPSGMNLQPVKYMIINDHDTVLKVFKYTAWAGALKGAGTPTVDERPRAFILLLIDTSIRDNCQLDIGAAAMVIQLMAQEEGLGSCWMGAINRKEIAKICNLSDNLKIDTLLSIGYPAEDPVSEDFDGENIDYYKDETGQLHVPKRTLEEVLIK